MDDASFLLSKYSFQRENGGRIVNRCGGEFQGKDWRLAINITLIQKEKASIL